MRALAVIAAALVVAACGDVTTVTIRETGTVTGAAATSVIGRYDSPVWAGSPPGDDRIFVVEQHTGRIMVVGSDTPWFQLPEAVASGNEQGLLGLAFHPDFATNGRFFVDFTNADGDTRVEEFKEGVAAPVRTWLEVDQPYANHNGGNVLFGPDGRLYVGMGDGGDAGDPENRAQDDGSLLGKLLAIDVDGGDATPQVVAKGLRNPWRFAFAADAASIWIGDVGQNDWEEVDHAPFPLPAGANFGWRLLEGTFPFADGGKEPPGYIAPVFEYSHKEGCSVTGGVVQADGSFLAADYCSGTAWSITDTASEKVDLAIAAPVHFGRTSDGDLLVVSGEGQVHRLSRR